MSVTGRRGVGIPIILMHDGEGTIVTIECQNGDLYRGFLDETEDSMNCIMKVSLEPGCVRRDAVDRGGTRAHVQQRGAKRKSRPSSHCQDMRAPLS